MSESSRREFILGVAAAGFGTTTNAAQSADTDQLNGLLHVVYFWLNNPDSESDRNDLVAGLKGLAQIPGIRALHVGVPASTEQRDVVDNSFDVAEVMVFDDVEAQNSYQVHPIHEAFVERYSPLWRNVIVYDSVSA